MADLPGKAAAADALGLDRAGLTAAERDQIVADLVADEGFDGWPYRDTRGHMTIGHGLKLPLTEAESRLLLAHRLDEKLDQLDQRLPWWRAQPRQVRRALANMAYQLGVGGLAGFRRMAEALQRGDRAAAEIEALDSAWAEQARARARRVAAWLASDD